ncbi:MAG: threonine synthase [Gemmatimonadales bacterium]
MTVVAPERSVRPLPLRCGHCGTATPASAQAACPDCLGPLEPVYPPDRARPSRAEIAARPPSLWRYREWLPLAGVPTLSLDTGFTPLVEAPRLAGLLGVARLWLKNDTVSHPSLSFKDRVVATAINAASGLGLDRIGCASTGNLAVAVAAQAARAGLPAVILIPDTVEPAKVIATAAAGARVIRVRGTYDDVNRLAVQLADRRRIGIVNVNLRPYYGEGSKTVAFEIAEQLGWRLPDAVVAPMAGGSLLSKLHKGFGEFLADGVVAGRVPRLYGAQAAGCAPIAAAVTAGSWRINPVVPDTVARSLAIGAPADGLRAVRAIGDSGGWAAAVADDDLLEAIRILAEHSGVFAETAGGVTLAGAFDLARAGRLGPADEVVLCLTAHGLKTPEAIAPDQFDLPVVSTRLADVERAVAD